MEKMMQHLGMCNSCYEQFCSALALLEVTSDCGYAILSEIYGMEYSKSFAKKAENKILVIVNLTKTKLMGNVDVVMKQIERSNDLFRFRPALVTATRGSADASKKMYKVEDLSDERTFIIMDPANDELLIQINANKIESDNIRVHLKSEAGETIADHPMEKKGIMRRCIIKNLPLEKIQIVIECEE